MLEVEKDRRLLAIPLKISAGDLRKFNTRRTRVEIFRDPIDFRVIMFESNYRCYWREE